MLPIQSNINDGENEICFGYYKTNCPPFSVWYQQILVLFSLRDNCAKNW